MAGMREVLKTKNGLNVVLVPTEAKSVTILAVIKAGSRDEAEGQYGGAHFLEHFVFKGTKKYPKTNDISRAVDSIGGLQNAFTSTDYTGYWVKVAGDQWQKGLEVVAQLVTEPLLPEGELKKEKGTIVEELKMYEDNYPIKALEKLDHLAFPDSPLGRAIIGFEDTINAMKISDLKAFRDRWYFPENIILVAVGQIDQSQKLLKEIEEQFGSLAPKKESVERIGYHQIFTQSEPKIIYTQKKTEQIHLALGWRTFPSSDKRDETLEMMNNILGGNMSSRLWNEIREKRGLAYYIKTFTDGHQDQGLSGIRAGIRVGKEQEAVKVIVGELEKLAGKEVTDKELVRGVASVTGRLKLEAEDSQEIAMMIADDFVNREAKIRTLDEILDALKGVTKTEIKKLAEEMLDKNQYCLSVVGQTKNLEVK